MTCRFPAKVDMCQQLPVLGDVTIAGQPRKVVMLANRNSFFYVLDRENGKLLVGKPFTGTKWAPILY